MRIIVVSDNHGLIEPLKKIRKKYHDADAFIHCGDSELSENLLAGFVAVRGNNDYYSDFPDTQIVSVGEIKILVLHGHQFFFRTVVKDIVKKAVNNHCLIACRGHTHVYDVQVMDGVTVVNPGSIRYNRDGTAPCFAIIDVVAGKVQVQRVNVSSLDA